MRLRRAVALTGSSDVHTAMEAEGLSQQALFDAFLDGAINSNDPRFGFLPAHLRTEVFIRQQHNAKFRVIEQHRQAVLAETGAAFEGSVSIAYGSKPSVLVINGLSMNDDDWFYRRLFGIPNTYDSRGIPRDDPFNQAQARLQRQRQLQELWPWRCQQVPPPCGTLLCCSQS